MAVNEQELRDKIEELEKARKETASDVKQKWEIAENASGDQVRIMKENIAFVEGMQYLRVRGQTIMNVQGVAKNRLKMVDNRTLDHVRRLHARLSQVQYKPTVTSETEDEGDKMSAKAAEAALRWFERTKRVNKKKRSASWWIVTCGHVYLEPYFDASAGKLEVIDETDDDGNPKMEPVLNPETQEPEFETDLETGQMALDPQTRMPVQKMRQVRKLEPIGDLDFVVRSPFQVKRDPRFQEWEKTRWVFVQEMADVDEVVTRFPDSEEAIRRVAGDVGKYQTMPWIPENVGESIGGSDQLGIQKQAPAVEGLVEVLRYYERPCSKYPEGRHVIMIGDEVVYDDVLGTPDGDLPLVPIGYLERPWILEGKSVVDSVKGIQRLFNRILSRYAEHLIRLPAGWLMVPSTAGIPRRGFTNEVGAVIRYAPGGGEPKFVFPPFQGLAWYDRFLVRLEQSFEERMALPPASRGQLPKGARAARTVELLQEAADTIQGPVLQDLADGWIEFYKKVLGLMHQRFTVPRLVAAIGDDKMADVIEFKGDMLPRDWRDRLRVNVEEGESLPSTKMMKMEMILTLAGRHMIFGPPGTPEYRKSLLEALGLDSGFIPRDEELDVNIAEMENVLLAKGEAGLPVRSIDSDEIHLRSHLKAAKRFILSGDEQTASMFMQHIEMHKMNLIKKMPAPPIQETEGPRGEPGGKQPLDKGPEPIAETVTGQDRGGG